MNNFVTTLASLPAPHFIRQGKCLYYREWNRPQNTLENAEDEGEEQRLMFGMLYSIKASISSLLQKAKRNARCTAVSRPALSRLTGCSISTILANAPLFWAVRT